MDITPCGPIVWYNVKDPCVFLETCQTANVASLITYRPYLASRDKTVELPWSLSVLSYKDQTN